MSILPEQLIDIAQLTAASTYQIRDITNHDMTVEDFAQGMADAASRRLKSALFMRADGQPIEGNSDWTTLRAELRAIDRTPQGKLTVTRDNTTGLVTCTWP